MIIPYFSSWAVGDGRPNAILPLVNGILVIATSILLIPRFGFVGTSLAQLWVVVIVLVHTSWVRRIVSPQLRSWGWLGALISPSLMIITWLLVTRISMLFVTPGSIAFYAIVLMGGIIGLAVVWSIERIVFPNQGRWVTLMQAVGILFGRMRSLALT
jgi:O-antigen/teichoic acid export membrane protein